MLRRVVRRRRAAIGSVLLERSEREELIYPKGILNYEGGVSDLRVLKYL